MFHNWPGFLKEKTYSQLLTVALFPSPDSNNAYRQKLECNDPVSVIREAARILCSGGQFLIVDFARHQQETLRTDHAHRRLGFSDDEIKLWCQQSNLKLQDAQIIPNQQGDDLTVKLWIIAKRSS